MQSITSLHMHNPLYTGLIQDLIKDDQGFYDHCCSHHPQLRTWDHARCSLTLRYRRRSRQVKVGETFPPWSSTPWVSPALQPAADLIKDQ